MKEKQEGIQKSTHWKKSPFFLFSFFFIFWLIYELLTKYKEGIDWTEAIFGSLFYAVFMTLTFRYILNENTPVYLKLSHYDRVLEIIEEIGATKTAEKGEKQVFKIMEGKWFNNKITLKKTAFYLYVQCPSKYRDHFTEVATIKS